jgi:hypothetical protein
VGPELGSAWLFHSGLTVVQGKHSPVTSQAGLETSLSQGRQKNVGEGLGLAGTVRQEACLLGDR